MKGKAKMIREADGKYHVYTRKHFWSRLKPLKLYPNSDPIVFNSFKEFAETTRIECFDEITLEYDKFRGYE